MQPLSATDAIAPAWNHTRRLLLDQRNPRLFFKIAAVAFFAEMANFTFSFGKPMHAGHGGGAGGISPIFVGAIVAIVLACVAIGLVVGLALFYLSSRLQFTLFHIVLRSETTVAPIWRRYAAATWRWMGLKLLFFLAAIACVAPIFIPAVLYFIHAVSQQSHGDHSHIVSFILTMFAFIVTVILFAITVAVVTILLRDFAVPSMALEGTPLRETVRRVIALARAETGQVALYVLLRVCLGIAGTFVSYMFLGLLALIVGAPLGGIGFGLWKGLHLAGPGAHVGMIFGWVLLALALLAVLAVGVISLFGYLFTFLQAYAIFFLGGRYPLMGQLLVEPPAPVAPTHQAQPWPLPYYTTPPV
jgi:hypothetical protein